MTGILLPLAVAFGLLTQSFWNTFPLLLKSQWVKVTIFLFALFAVAISYSSAPFPDALHTLGKYSRLLLMALLIPTFLNSFCRKYAILAFLTAITLTLIISYLQFFGVPNLPHQYGQAAIFKDRIQTNFLMAFGFYLFAQHLIDQHFRFQKIALFFMFSNII